MPPVKQTKGYTVHCPWEWLGCVSDDSDYTRAQQYEGSDSDSDSSFDEHSITSGDKRLVRRAHASGNTSESPTDYQSSSGEEDRKSGDATDEDADEEVNKSPSVKEECVFRLYHALY
jgi:hypothetical protein